MVSRSPQIALPFDAPADLRIAPTCIPVPTIANVGPTRVVVAPTGIERPVEAGHYTDGPAEAGRHIGTVEPTHVISQVVYFVRHRRARRYLLRVDADGRLRVTIPRGGSKREAEAFVRRNQSWVAQQRARIESQAS